MKIFLALLFVFSSASPAFAQWLANPVVTPNGLLTFKTGSPLAPTPAHLPIGQIYFRGFNSFDNGYLVGASITAAAADYPWDQGGRNASWLILRANDNGGEVGGSTSMMLGYSDAWFWGRFNQFKIQLQQGVPLYKPESVRIMVAPTPEASAAGSTDINISLEPAGSGIVSSTKNVSAPSFSVNGAALSVDFSTGRGRLMVTFPSGAQRIIAEE